MIYPKQEEEASDKFMSEKALLEMHAAAQYPYPGVGRGTDAERFSV